MYSLTMITSQGNSSEVYARKATIGNVSNEWQKFHKG